MFFLICSLKLILKDSFIQNLINEVKYVFPYTFKLRTNIIDNQ